MTIEQLKGYKGCEHYTDEQATEMVESLRMFATAIIEVWPENCIDNQCIGSSNGIINSEQLIVPQVNKAA